MGCGCGVIGLSLFIHGLINEPLYASDLSETAIENVIINAKNITHGELIKNKIS